MDKQLPSIVMNAILGNSHPHDDYHLVFLSADEVSTVVNQITMAVQPKLVESKDHLELRQFLECMQAGEMTVSRGLELIDLWLYGKYSNDMLPAPEPCESEKAWSYAVATIIGVYLNEPIDSDKCKAIGGIIERRLWSLPREKKEPCTTCGGAVSVHSPDGEYRGECPHCAPLDVQALYEEAMRVFKDSCNHTHQAIDYFRVILDIAINKLKEKQNV